jgi:large subunit ribosomal protein L4
MCAQKTKKMQATNNSAFTHFRSEEFAAVPERTIDKTAFAVYIRALLQNWRQGTVGCKGRSDVSYSNKKPWKQKGTGRARAGSARSPLWVGGGVIFGPQPRVRTLKISKSTKRGVLNSLFWDYLEREKIGYVDWQLTSAVPKTSDAFKALADAGLGERKVTLFLDQSDVLHYASFVNIPHVNIVFFDEANAYDIAHAEQWVVLKKDLDSFKKMVTTWN